MGVIYSLSFNDSDKLYVGSAHDWSRRLAHHRWALRHNKHHSVHLQRALNKRGFEELQAAILETVEDNSLLIQREQFWMEHFRGRLYNIATVAGSNLGVRKTPEQKEQCSKFHRGRKRTIETRARQAEARKLWWQNNPEGVAKTRVNPGRDIAIAAAYYSASSLTVVGPLFGIKGAAAWHAVNRVYSRLAEFFQTVSPLYEKVPRNTKIHPDWLDLLIEGNSP